MKLRQKKQKNKKKKTKTKQKKSVNATSNHVKEWWNGRVIITLYQIILFMTCFSDKTESSCRDAIEPGLFSSGGSMVDD